MEDRIIHEKNVMGDAANTFSIETTTKKKSFLILHTYFIYLSLVWHKSTASMYESFREEDQVLTKV